MSMYSCVGKYFLTLIVFKQVKKDKVKMITKYTLLSSIFYTFTILKLHQGLQGGPIVIPNDVFMFP